MVEGQFKAAEGAEAKLRHKNRVCEITVASFFSLWQKQSLLRSSNLARGWAR
jgi:hypothetical protein